MKLAIFAATLALASSAFAQGSLVVPAGTTMVYDTINGPLLLVDLTIEPGAVLRAQGVNPFHVHATGTARIDGLLDFSGFDNPGVNTWNTGTISEFGALGGPAGGRGGTGNPLTSQSSPAGTSGFGPPQWPRVGGRGGESGISTIGIADPNTRRPGGGGGGTLAADQPVHSDPLNPANLGLLAGTGKNGWATALGVLSMTPPPLGGAVGNRAFVDADPTNDFYGLRLNPTTGVPTVGELQAPTAGAGGGGGGNAINGLVWPPTPYDPTSDEKGAGGGGGGGLGIVAALRISVGAQGKIRCNGGHGGGGENTNFLDRIGGGSGGGSGGYLILQAGIVDLSAAGDRALTALGGRGGEGKDNAFNAINAGGNGGPGVITIQIPPHTNPLLPAGKSLADMSAPVAQILLPNRRF